MIAIPTSKDNVIKALDNFRQKLPPLVTGKLEKEISKAGETSPLGLALIRLRTEIEKILMSKPADLLDLSDDWQSQLVQLDADGKEVDSALGTAVKTVFNYDWFIKKRINRYCAYDLCEDLKVNVCVYCNRQYTHTLITQNKKKLSRPTLDHFFNKARHSLLALSFYNLIPSCAICNSSVKHEANFDLAENYHPYLDDFIDQFTFAYKPDKTAPYGWRISVESKNSKAVTTLSALETAELYAQHALELQEMIDLKKKFSDNYLNILNDKVLKKLKHKMGDEELYRLAFGTEIIQAKFGQRPFSKFKYDIFIKLGIIADPNKKI